MRPTWVRRKITSLMKISLYRFSKISSKYGRLVFVFVEKNVRIAELFLTTAKKGAQMEDIDWCDV